MKKRIICVFLVFVLMLVPFTVNAARSSSSLSFSWTGNVSDNRSSILLGMYDLQFSLNPYTNALTYAFIAYPPCISPKGQAKSSLSYTVKMYDANYGDMLKEYGKNECGFYDYFFKEAAERDIAAVTLKSETGRISKDKSAFSGEIDIRDNADKIFCFEIEIDSMFRTQFEGKASVVVLCGVSEARYGGITNNYYYEIID